MGTYLVEKDWRCIRKNYMPILGSWKLSVEEFKGPEFRAARRFIRKVGFAEGRSISIRYYNQVSGVLGRLILDQRGSINKGVRTMLCQLKKPRDNTHINLLLLHPSCRHHTHHLAYRFVPKYIGDLGFHHSHIRRVNRRFT